MYPKTQIPTVKDPLENPQNLFEMPDSARQPRSHGIGALQPGQEEMHPQPTDSSGAEATADSEVAGPCPAQRHPVSSC